MDQVQASCSEANALRRVRVLIAGRVQGVFFRAATREQANALGLTGWVRNLANGCVEIVAEGPAANVDSLLQWCGHGPPRARVDRVDLSEETPGGQFGEFEVRRDG